KATDPLGNSNTTSNPAGLVVDRTAPAILVTSREGDPTKAATFVVNVTFNEAVTGFAATDVAVTNGKVSGFTALDAQTYRFVVAPQADGAVVVTVAAGAAADAAGNPSPVGSLSRTSDKTAPIVTVTPKTTNAADP